MMMAVEKGTRMTATQGVTNDNNHFSARLFASINEYNTVYFCANLTVFDLDDYVTSQAVLSLRFWYASLLGSPHTLIDL
jgi:hypothetical protein